MLTSIKETRVQPPYLNEANELETKSSNPKRVAPQTFEELVPLQKQPSMAIQ